MGNSNIKAIIRGKGLTYKEVAKLLKSDLERVCAEVNLPRLSAEKAMEYGRALGVDPAIIRPDVFKPGEVNFK